jgi:hypothetical protein
MAKRKPIEALLKEFLAARKALLNEKAEIERQVRNLADAPAWSVGVRSPVLHHPQPRDWRRLAWPPGRKHGLPGADVGGLRQGISWV